MNALELRRRTLGKGVYKKTVEGNPAIAQGSLARRYPGITMQGWTEQAQYEGKNLFNPEQFYDKNTYSEKYGNYYLTTWQLKPNTVYRFTVYNNHVSPRDNEVMFFGFNDAFNNHDPNGSLAVFTSSDEKTAIENSGESGVLFVKINSRSDPETQLESLKNANVIISEGAEKIPYEPYTGGQPSPNPDYPQEIISAGKYNEDAQKWEYEITIANAQTDPDKNQTVLLTSDRPLTKWDRLEKRNGQWGWVYKSNMLSVPKAGYIARGSLVKDGKYFTAENLVPDSKISSVPREGSQYCNIFNLGNPYEREGNLFWIYRSSENKNGDLQIGLSDTSIDTKELFEQYISDKDIYIWYETAEETFVPLSESEQEALNALHTFRPTTVLSNDCDCNMSLTYKTKKSLEVAT